MVRWRNGRRTTCSDNPRANDKAKWVAVNTKQSTSFTLTWSSVQEWFVTIEDTGSNPVLTTMNRAVKLITQRNADNGDERPIYSFL